MNPVSELNNKPARETREVNVRPQKQSGIDLFGYWLKKQDWLSAQTVDLKTEIFQKLLLMKCNEVLPSKTRKISSYDQPFWTEKLESLKRHKSREYHKNRKSLKWRD